MACRKSIKQNIEERIKKDSDHLLGLNLIDAKKGANKINKEFGTKVISFVQQGDFIDRVIDIPESLIDEFQNYFENLEELQGLNKRIENDFNNLGIDPITGDSDTSLFDPASLTPKPSYNKLIKLRENQIEILKSKLNEVYKDKNFHKTDIDLYKEDIKLENEIKDTIEKLEEDLNRLNNNSLSKVLKEYIQEDINRLEQLVKSSNPLDLQEATDIISFYSSMSNIDDNPFFTKEQVLSPEYNQIRNDLSTVKSELGEENHPSIIAKHYEELLDLKKKESILELTNRDIRVQTLFGRNITEKELFGTSGAKDINWIDMFIQDPQFQIGTANPLIAQIKGMILEDAVNRHILISQGFIERLEALEEKLSKELPRLKYGPFSIPDYTIFRAKDKDGLLMDSIVSRYTSEVFEKEKDKTNVWKEQRLNASDKDKESRKIIYDNLKKEMFNWYREHFNFIQINNIQEIIDEFPEAFDSIDTITDANYENNLKKELGEYGYREEIDKQKKLIKEYLVQFEVKKEELKLALENNEITEEEYKKQLNYFKKSNNPIEFLKHLNNNTVPNVLDYTKVYLSKIPRKTKAKINSRTGLLEETNEETGYWDNNFKQIEENDTFREFHELLKEFIDDVYSGVNPNERNNFNMFSIPAVEKGVIENLADPRLEGWAKLSHGWRAFIDKLRSMFTERALNSASYAQINPLTGEEKFKISSQDLKFNKKEINQKLAVEIQNIRQAINLPINSKLPVKYKITPKNQKVINIIARNLGVEPTYDAIKNKLPNTDLNNVNLYRLLRKAITNKVVSDNTIDLPKILRVASHSLAMYKARHEQLYTQLVIRDIYNDINKPIVNNHGVQGKDDDDNELVSKEKRTNAIKQSESWFKRAVLGNYEKNKLSESPVLSTGIGKVGIKKIDDKLENLKLPESLKSNNQKEIEEIDKTISNLENELLGADKKQSKLLNKKINELKYIRNSKIKHYSLTAFIENVVFKATRFLGLGYNLSSGLTNFLEGQISNMTAAAQGRYFSEESYWKAVDITKYSFLRNTTFNKIRSTNSPILKEKLLQAELARKLMDNYDILQDAYNELQKASVKSKLSSWLARFNSKEITSRVEYQNQSQVMIAILMDTLIEGKDGTQMSVWDSMIEGVKEGKELGRLSDNFATDENKLTYENLSKNERQSLLNKNVNFDTHFKSKITDTIVKLHGDYNELRGNMASESIPGQALMMFRRWVGSYLYNRFGTQQYNLRAGTIEKGRYRSMTTAQAAFIGSVAGTAFFGPLGTIIGAGVGGTIGKFLPKGWKAEKIMTTPESRMLGTVQEMALLTGLLVKRTMSLPINLFSGKLVVNSNKFNHIKSLEKWNEAFQNKYDKKDIENIRGNIAEMAMSLWITALTLLVKSIAWDDDDDNEDTRRIIHNIAVNKLMGLHSQLYSFLDLTDDGFYYQLSNLAVLRTVTNVFKTADALIDLIEGNDVITAGPNYGQSKFKNQFSKTFLPSPLRGKLGFDSQSKRQFEESPWDDMFHNEETLAKREARKLKVEEINKRITNDLSEEKQLKIKKQIDSLFRKRKGESNVDKLNRIKKYLSSKDEEE